MRLQILSVIKDNQNVSFEVSEFERISHKSKLTMSEAYQKTKKAYFNQVFLGDCLFD